MLERRRRPVDRQPVIMAVYQNSESPSPGHSEPVLHAGGNRVLMLAVKRGEIGLEAAHADTNMAMAVRIDLGVAQRRAAHGAQGHDAAAQMDERS